MLSETSPAELDSPNKKAEEQYRALLNVLLLSILPIVPSDSPASLKFKELLRDLEEPIEAAKLGDYRSSIEECIPSLQHDLAKLRRAVEQGVAGAAADSATGLPGPTAAQELISSRVNEGRPTFAAILVLDQLRALNARFGRNVGDEVLRLAAQELAIYLDGAGVLHRWRGPAFLVVCTNGQQQVEDLDTRIRELVARRMESTINVENRAIHVKLTFSWRVDQVAGNADTAARAFDDFVAGFAGAPVKGGR